jgi:NAD(P)H-quinone oxidoreductase subunit 2
MNSSDFKLIVQNSHILALIPELSIILAIVVTLLMSLSNKVSKYAWIVSSSFLFLGLIYVLSMYSSLNQLETFYSFKGTFITDHFSLLIKGLILLATFAVTLSSSLYSAKESFTSKGEFQLLILGFCLGASFLTSANDMILTFVSVETMALSTIALIALQREKSITSEAALKYLINSGVATAFMLFSFSILFGLSLGNTVFSYFPHNVAHLMGYSSVFPLVLFATALILLICAVAAKLALVPFHLWSPDVFEGAPFPVTALLSTVSKLAVFALIMRLGWTVFAIDLMSFSIWANVLAFLALLSIIVGNLVGFRQVFSLNGSIKRLFAYSSIAQLGYVISCAVLGPDTSAESSFFYLITYTLVNVAFFVGLMVLENQNKDEVTVDSLDSLKGLYQRKPILSIYLSVCLANLAAIIPGMLISKLILVGSAFRSALAQWLPADFYEWSHLNETTYIVRPELSVLITISILVFSLVAAFYYFALIKNIFFEKTLPEYQEMKSINLLPSKRLIMSLASGVILIIGSLIVAMNPETWIKNIAGKAAQSLIMNGNNDIYKVLDESIKTKK